MRHATLTDAVLHARAQALRHAHAEILLRLDGLQEEPVHDASGIAAGVVSAAVNGDRDALQAFGIDCPGEGPVSDVELEEAFARFSRVE